MWVWFSVKLHHQIQAKAHSSEWAFCYVAFVMGWGGVAFSKYSMLVLLAVVFIAFLWRFGRAAFKGVTKWLLWALAVLCTCAGVIVLRGSLWRFSVRLLYACSRGMRLGLPGRWGTGGRVRRSRGCAGNLSA